MCILKEERKTVAAGIGYEGNNVALGEERREREGKENKKEVFDSHVLAAALPPCLSLSLCFQCNDSIQFNSIQFEGAASISVNSHSQSQYLMCVQPLRSATPSSFLLFSV